MALDPLEPVVGETFGHALERIAEGGLLQLVVSKPVQQAIGRLIFGAAEVPVAKMEQWAQAIRSETAAQKLITSAIATEVKKKAVGDPALVERATDRWTARLLGRQAVREEVAARALTVLAEDLEAPRLATGPSEDFMLIYEDIVDKISSDNLKDLMARILAGEVRKPGTVSRKTLQLVSILDGEIVSALSLVAPHITDPGFLHIPPSKAEAWRAPLALLASVGIVNEPGMRQLAWNEEHRAGIAGKDTLLVLFAEKLLFSPFINGANLTASGSEILKLLPFPGDPDFQEIANGYAEHSFILKVQFANLVEANGEKVPTNHRDKL